MLGPVRLAELHKVGLRTWPDILAAPALVPRGLRRSLLEECCRCLAALESDDIRYFVDHFQPHDQWRILAHYQDYASFFDIETLGLEYDAPITVISVWHRGELRTFVDRENLDEFLDLLDEVTLLVSFNGSSFDVPRILDWFHIPALPCPHIDLRWACYHQGFCGGLKQIGRRFGLPRPDDLEDTDGGLAVTLWNRWQLDKDRAARDLLVRYCCADVLLSVMITARLNGQPLSGSRGTLWEHLPPASREQAPQRANAVVDHRPMGVEQLRERWLSRMRAHRRIAG